MGDRLSETRCSGRAAGGSCTGYVGRRGAFLSPAACWHACGGGRMTAYLGDGTETSSVTMTVVLEGF